MTDTDDRNPIEEAVDQVLDVFVYLPLGFVLDFPRSIPRYIERGRQELMPARQVERLQAHTVSTLRALGVMPASRSSNGHGPDHGHETTSPAPPRSTVGSPPPAPPRPVPVDSGIDPETLAIPDYDSLSASQVVPRLDGLGPDELEQVRRYENGKRVRKTILSKIAQLQAT